MTMTLHIQAGPTVEESANQIRNDFGPQAREEFRSSAAGNCIAGCDASMVPKPTSRKHPADALEEKLRGTCVLGENEGIVKISIHRASEILDATERPTHELQVITVRDEPDGTRTIRRVGVQRIQKLGRGAFDVNTTPPDFHDGKARLFHPRTERWKNNTLVGIFRVLPSNQDTGHN